ncbi:MAG: mechanosensitive ion channel [Candidatus Pacearchaeota archaeon]
MKKENENLKGGVLLKKGGNKKPALKIILILFALFFIITIYLFIKINEIYERDNFLKNGADSKVENLLKNFLLITIIFVSTSLFITITKKIIKKSLLNLGKTKENIKLILVVYEYLFWIIIIIVTFSIFVKGGSSLLTSLGLVGFGLTLALQKPILNFVGWITIVFGKQYSIGDIISIDEKKGEVYDIKFMYTSLSELNKDGDPTGKAFFIPNEFIFSKIVVNYTKGTPFIWDEIAIYLTYKSNLKKALNIVEREVQRYYDKNILNEVRREFEGVFEGYKRIVTRLDAYDKGVVIKVRYLVYFNKSNEYKKEIIQKLLSKLKSKDIFLGKVESVS